MLLYHIDRAGTLRPGNSIDLVPIDQLPETLKGSELFARLDLGLSRHAITYLNPICTPQPYTIVNGQAHCSMDTLWHQLSFADHRILEYTFELVRRAHFPQYPSRFQCLFALRSIDDFKSWPELSQERATIYEIEAPDTTHCFDAAWLKGGLNRGISQRNYHISYAPTLCFDMAYKYWSKIPSDSPRWEYLIPLPISGTRVHSTAQYQPADQEVHQL